MSELIIGLTGGIGSGKTTITTMFAKQGIDIIDADIIAREVVAPGSKALIAIERKFGSTIIQQNRQLNRALLRSIIFSNDADKHWLNELLHPLIRSEIISQTLNAKSAYCLLVAPLLIENNLLNLVDRVLVVDVTEMTQLKRTLARDETSNEQEINAIISSQTTRIDRLASADDIIDNDTCELTHVKKEVTKLHQQYLMLVEDL